MNRRGFLQTVAGSASLAALDPVAAVPPPAAKATINKTGEDGQIQQLIDAHRPSHLAKLPPDFNARVGAAHVAGKYHLTSKPFLIEGAEKLLALATRLGKFWLMPASSTRSYPYNSHWPPLEGLLNLAYSDYFQQLFALPFSTIILEAAMPREWPAGEREAAAAPLKEITQAYFDLTAYFYKLFRDRPVTVILQHWEGDWMLRGKDGEKWDPPPANWKARCESMQRWLAARQAGVAKARAVFSKDAKCRVVHAAEVNRVADLWKGIPTMTEHVLPGVELDLISYSCYDGMKDGITLWKCIGELKARARTSGLFGNDSVFIGEVGIPENERPERLSERWDELLGVMLAAKTPYIAMWQLYCNEFNTKLKPPPVEPVKKLSDMRGFWLVRPDGSLSETGKYFTSLWQRT